MPWEQFIANENAKGCDDVEIFFKLSSSIPYIAYLDEHGTVLRSHVGLMTVEALEDFILSPKAQP